METLSIDYKQIEKECFLALEQGDMESFLNNFNMYIFSTLKDANYSLLLSYHLLYLLSTDKKEYYYMKEKLDVDLYDDPNIEFVFDIERIFYEGNLRRLNELKKDNSRFAKFVDILIRSLEKEMVNEITKDADSRNIVDKENVQMIKDCMDMIKNYSSF